MKRIDKWPLHVTGLRRTRTATTPSGMSLVTWVLRSVLAVNTRVLRPVESVTAFHTSEASLYVTLYDVTHSSASWRPCVVMDDTVFTPSKYASIHGLVSLPSADHAPARIDLLLSEAFYLAWMISYGSCQSDDYKLQMHFSNSIKILWIQWQKGPIEKCPREAEKYVCKYVYFSFGLPTNWLEIIKKTNTCLKWCTNV